MKLTRKMSPLLMGLVAVLVGCSMMGAAISVIVSPAVSSTGTATVTAESVTLAAPAASDLDVLFAAHPTSNIGQDYPDWTTTAGTTMGGIYDTMVNVTCAEVLPNLVLTIRIDKLDGTAISGMDVALKEFSDRNNELHVDEHGMAVPSADNGWVPIHLESYGDYLLGYVENCRNGFSVTGTTGPLSYCVDYYYVISFALEGTYQITWTALGQDGATAVA